MSGLGKQNRTELDQLQSQANKVTDDSLESTRRMLSLCEESKEAGISCLVGLDEQGEQLDRIDEGMDQINADMKEAEKNLSGMEKCCGICTVPCNKIKKFQEDAEESWKSDRKSGGVVTGQPQRVMDANNGVPSGAMQVARITNDAREDEMEDNLGQVNNMVDNLRNMALDMGSELDNQVEQIKVINTKGLTNETRIRTANERANCLLKKPAASGQT